MSRIPEAIEIHGARANNLKNINVNIPLNRFVAVCGVSGSGKSTLATDVLYAEGSRRYLEALSTYTRRRIGQTARPEVDSIRFLPSAVALRQRPTVPGIRSTLGTMSELLNILRLSFSRLGSHVCPNGHRQEPSLTVAQTGSLTCPVCHVVFNPPSAEDFAFNAQGACPTCHGTGEVREVDETTLIGDPDKTIQEGAVAGWRVPGSFFYPRAAEKLGIPLDVPYKDLPARQKKLILGGQSVKVPVEVTDRSGRVFRMEATYLNARDAVEHAFRGTDSEKSLARLNKFYRIGKCPACGGSRFAPHLLKSLLDGKTIADVSALSLEGLAQYARTVKKSLPKVMEPLAAKLMQEVENGIHPLLLLGLDYLSLDRAGSTLSTGELQRIQLARTLKNETTGVLYVLDEPSIGLHPANVTGLFDVFEGLLNQGNSLVVVDHDTAILGKADYLVEMGPGAGSAGGTIVSEGTVEEVVRNPSSIIAPYLTGNTRLLVRTRSGGKDLLNQRFMRLTVNQLYTLKNVDAAFPSDRLSVVTGVSGSGKTALVLDSLVPALTASIKKQPPPAHVRLLDTGGIRRVVTVDAVPVGKNDRSTVATYSGVFDAIRELFAATPAARKKYWNAGRFSYNLKEGACPTCGGTGDISLDIQYLPDMVLVCPECGGKRYNQDTLNIVWEGYTIADILSLPVSDAWELFTDYPAIHQKLSSLAGLGLGYLTLGESTPELSGGEAQRLKLVSEMGRTQKGTLFVFDEPTIGLHPQDIRTLIQVFDSLLDAEATIIVIEHDLDVIANADYVLDMGPRGGDGGGRVMAAGTPQQLCHAAESLTGKNLSAYVRRFGLDW
ncbi:excinuclease ABC subunit UvrA [Breznakiella homolactica]|uniref:UvrABC system protein A n=1 Tax=Breznakiella homolactica TaxID=2798577 RepID=A0A7T8BCC8_9SPIR|nr:excinuclease ABC subunit UvrA [Breznakiella homolactica]